MGHETVDIGGQRSRSHEAKDRFGGWAEASFWTPLGLSRFSSLCFCIIVFYAAANLFCPVYCVNVSCIFSYVIIAETSLYIHLSFKCTISEHSFSLVS